MKSKFLIVLAILLGIMGTLSFFVFFYPDEKLQDLSDLTPSIQNVTDEDNAFYLIEGARKNFKKSPYDVEEMISFLMNKSSITELNKTQNLTDENIAQFLTMENSSIKLLEEAEQLPHYKNPQEDDYLALNFVSTLSSTNPSAISLIQVLFVKGLNEIKLGQSEGLQTIIQAMELGAKMRQSSLSVMDYLLINNVIEEGKDIIDYFRNNRVPIPAEIEARIKGVQDSGWQEYINALKFEFQLEINQFDEVITEAEGHPFINNRFNFRKNATINSLAIYMRDLIDEAKNFNCTKKSTKSFQSNDKRWTYLFKENSIGQSYISMVAIENSSKLFCGM